MTSHTDVIMVDITPKGRNKMKKNITKTDIGELEFQMGYHTQLHAKAYKDSPTIIDVILTDSYGELLTIYESLQYIVKLDVTENEIKLNQLIVIRGKNDKLSIAEMNAKVNHALQIFNYLLGW